MRQRVPSSGSSRGYLVYDQRDISILDAPAAREVEAASAVEMAEYEPDLARQAAGDVIVIPTEAGIDTYLYWDGQGFRFFEPNEIP